MSHPERPEINVHLANTEYQDIEDIQFYDNEKYDNICNTILYYNKILIQNYQN